MASDDASVVATVRSWVGSEPTDPEILTRHDRLGNPNLVAREILTERRAELLVDPLSIEIVGDYKEDLSGNLTALDQTIAAVDAALGTVRPGIGKLTSSRFVRSGRER